MYSKYVSSTKFLRNFSTFCPYYYIINNLPTGRDGKERVGFPLPKDYSLRRLFPKTYLTVVDV